MRHNKHLHIAEQDPIADWLVKSMKAAQTGTIKLDMEGQPAVKIDIINYGNKIVVDLLQPVFFRTTDDETGLLDKLKTAREFASSYLCHTSDMTSHWLNRVGSVIPRGFSRHYVLTSIKDVPMSVKEITDKAIAESGDLWKPSPSSIYPMIAKLIDEG